MSKEKKTVQKENVFLRVATIADVTALEVLMNRCYRNAEGWTNEAQLIGGIRTTQDELQNVINDPQQYLFVYPKTDTGLREGEETGEILACIGVQGQPADVEDDTQHNSGIKAYIGMFAVHPDLQGQGIGDVVLNAAETFAMRHFGSESAPCRLTMSILNHRPELLAYYQRRGYELTGESMPFPNDGNNGEPLREDLQLLTLEKVQV
jgi:ribosomal protein S18 acetylase RimI-like enzyme